MVTLYDLLKVGPGQLFPSDPAAHFNARFRLVVFCPFQDEVLVGTLIKADQCALPFTKPLSKSLYSRANDHSTCISCAHLAADKFCWKCR